MESQGSGLRSDYTCAHPLCGLTSAIDREDIAAARVHETRHRRDDSSHCNARDRRRGIGDGRSVEERRPLPANSDAELQSAANARDTAWRMREHTRGGGLRLRSRNIVHLRRANDTGCHASKGAGSVVFAASTAQRPVAPHEVAFRS